MEQLIIMVERTDAMGRRIADMHFDIAEYDAYCNRGSVLERSVERIRKAMDESEGAKIKPDADSGFREFVKRIALENFPDAKAPAVAKNTDRMVEALAKVNNLALALQERMMDPGGYVVRMCDLHQIEEVAREALLKLPEGKN